MATKFSDQPCSCCDKCTKPDGKGLPTGVFCYEIMLAEAHRTRHCAKMWKDIAPDYHRRETIIADAMFEMCGRKSD